MNLKHCRRIMCAFAIGQVVQIVLFVIASSISTRPGLWGAAAGFIISMAVLAGMCVVSKEVGETTRGRTGGK